MPSTNRRFTTEFKFQLCAAIRAGDIGRREAQRAHNLSNSLIHGWLVKFDTGKLYSPERAAEAVRDRRDHYTAELERKIGRLTLEVDRLTAALAKATAGNDNLPVQNSIAAG